jgi:hypothetical protein
MIFLSQFINGVPLINFRFFFFFLIFLSQFGRKICSFVIPLIDCAKLSRCDKTEIKVWCIELLLLLFFVIRKKKKKKKKKTVIIL